MTATHRAKNVDFHSPTTMKVDGKITFCSSRKASPSVHCGPPSWILVIPFKRRERRTLSVNVRGVCVRDGDELKLPTMVEIADLYRVSKIVLYSTTLFSTPQQR